jgi:Holliday junction resolvase-like predicted endonuclease
MLNSLAMLERHASALDLRLDLRLVGRTGQLVRLADEEHAAIAEAIAGWLRRSGLEVEAEASFSEWGERGRIDLLAYDPHTGTVVIVEVKTLLLDLQELLGSMDVRERLVAVIARRRGWRIERRVTMLAVAASVANRTVVRSHAALFQTFTVRRLGRPGLDAAGRMLVWVTPQRTSRRTWVTGRERVRPRSAQLPIANAYLRVAAMWRRSGLVTARSGPVAGVLDIARGYASG